MKKIIILNGSPILPVGNSLYHKCGNIRVAMLKLILTSPKPTLTGVSLGAIKRTNIQSSPELATSSPMAINSVFVCFRNSPAKSQGTTVIKDFLSFLNGTLGVAQSINSPSLL